MKYNFTLLKIVRTLLLALCCMIGAEQVMAQAYTASLVESDPSQNTGYYSAIAKDNSGNLYVVKYNGSGYRLYKWNGGNPTSLVPLSMLASDPVAFQIPWGVAVNSTNNDVFVISANIGVGYEILRHQGGTGGPTSVQQGKMYSAICLDNNNNLLAVERSGPVGSSYQITRYTSEGGGSGTVLYSGIADPGDGTFPWGIDTDTDGNIYVTNFYNGGAGGIIKLTAPAFGRTDILTGRYFTGLTIDASNTMYAVERDGANPIYKVTKFANASGTGTQIYSGLTEGFGTYPWGIVEHNGDLYVNDGSATTDINGDPCGGQVLKLSPPNIHILSINRFNPTATSTNASSVQFLVTFDGPANGVSASNFIATVVNGSITGMTIDPVTGSGNTRVVTVNTGSGNGTIRLDMANVTGITPAVDNPMPYTLGQTILIDKIAPTGAVTINGGAAYTNNASVSLSLNAADGGGSGGLTMAISEDGTNFGAFGPYTSPMGYLFNGPDGQKTVYIRLRDEAGNESVVFQDDIILDRTAPETGIEDAPPALTNEENASFTFTSDDPNATFEYELDGSPFFPTGNPFNVFGLPAGTHTFSVRAKDLAGNVDPTPETYTWTIDTEMPSVTSVGVPANDTYGVGGQMDFTVTFNEDVVVDATGGIPYITLNIGGTTRTATYVSGSNTPNLVFRYTVAAGDLDKDGIGVSGPITLDGGIITDIAGNEAILTLNSIGNTAAVLVDGVGPVVTSVEVPADGYYNEGDYLDFIVHFDEVVRVTGTPSIDVNIGGVMVPANFLSGANSNALRFRHIVAAGENDEDGIELGGNISLNTGRLWDAADNDATLTLNAVENTSGVLVNTVIPTVNLTGTAQLNQPWTMTITFSEEVSNFELADINCNNCTVSSLNTTNDIVYTVTVTAQGDGPVSVNVPANVAENMGGNGNAASNTITYEFDGTAPAITSVDVPASDYYSEGEDLNFTVNFSEAVNVTGTPSLQVMIGAATVQATYTGGSGTSALTFAYTVLAGQSDLNGLALGTTLALNGGTITDLSENNAMLTLNGVGPISNVLVDAVAPTVFSVSVPVNAYYREGQMIGFAVNTTENVIVTGTPTLDIVIGSVTRKANYTGGSGTNSLFFVYYIVAGDNDMDGVTVGTLDLNGGTVRDAAGNDMNLTLNNIAPTNNVFVNTVIPAVTLSGPPVRNAPWTMTITFSDEVTGFALTDISATNATLSGFTTSDNTTYTVLVTATAGGNVPVSLSVAANVATNIGGNANTASNTINYVHDDIPPTVTSVNVPPFGGYKAGDDLDFTVHFDENVTVTGTPSVPIIIGSTIEQATYVSGTGTGSLVFRYTVQDGDLDDNGIAVNPAIVLNGGMITDEATNNAVPVLSNVNSTSGVVVDAVAPVVTSVSVPADGYYKGGQQLYFTVHFSENVTPSAVPSIPVTIGATVVEAAYVSGAGTSALYFTYTVQPGDMDMDGIAVGAGIALNAGTIRDGVGNNAVLALNNIAPTNNVFVNTNSPSVVLSGAPDLNGPWTLTITFEENVTGFTETDITAANANLSNFSQVSPSVYTVQVEGASDNPVSLSVAANVAINIAGNGNAPSNTLSYIHDATGPAITTVTVPADGTYNVGDVLNFTVNFNEDVMVTNTPSLPLTIGTTTVAANYTGGSGSNALTFSYTVQNGQSDLDGITIGTALSLNNGNITDLATNNADLTINGAGNTSAVLVDALAPVITAVTVPADDYYKAGEVLLFTVQFSEPVVSTGSTATLPVTIGTTTVQAARFSMPTPNTIVYRYEVQAGEMDMDGITVGSALVPGGTPIRDAVGNSADLTLNNVGSTSNVFVLGSRPTVSISGITGSNVAWTATIVFSHPVTGFTISDIALTNAVASDFQVINSTTYTALISPQVQGTVSVQIPANVAEDMAGNLNEASGTLFYSYDPNPPFITSVEVPANGYYKEGDVLNFAVNWNEIVRVNATPSTLTLPVIIGNKTVQAGFVTGFGTTRLTFAYTVQAGDLDLDGIQLGTALEMTRTDVRFTDQSNNPAILTLNGVPNTSGVFVHTARPSVALTSAAAARVNAPFTVTATFNEAVTQLTASDFTITNGTASNLQTADNITYTVLVTPGSDGSVTISLPADVAENVVNYGNTASNSITRTNDITPPVIAAGQHFTVSQYSPAGTVVGTVTATDASGTVQNWAIATDGSAGALEISTAGVISVKNTSLLNALVGTDVSLGLTVSDSLNTSTAVPVTVRVVFVNQPPTLDVITNVAICNDVQTHTIQLTGASATEPSQTYTITATSNRDIFDELSVDAGDVLSYRLKADASAGAATVTVTIRDNGGTSGGAVDSLRRTFTITVNALPVVTITSDKGASVSKGDVVRLTATGGSTYEWTAADGIISGQRTAVLEVRPQANITYEVTATSAAGCTATGSFALSVVTDFKVDATNILTPNGDGRNDRWVIRNLDSYPDNEVKIYDRAGRLIYSRRNYSNDWDGTINGSPLAEGTYYYILTIQNGARTATGYITIVRDRY